MKRYSASPRVLGTGKTLWSVTDFEGRNITGYSNKTACESLASLLNDKEIQTMNDWLELPNNVRKSFIITFCEIRPNL